MYHEIELKQEIIHNNFNDRPFFYFYYYFIVLLLYYYFYYILSYISVIFNLHKT